MDICVSVTVVTYTVVQLLFTVEDACHIFESHFFLFLHTSFPVHGSLMQVILA